MLGSAAVGFGARAHVTAPRVVRVARGGGAAHTIGADAEGLDVLASSSGSDTHMTWLPRAGAWWMGPRWLPSDGPSPFRLEAEAGALELPEPAAERPATVLATDEVPL